MAEAAVSSAAREWVDSGSAALRLLIDGRGITSSGIGRYLRELLSRFVEDERFGHIVVLGDPAEVRESLLGKGTDSGRITVEDFRHGMYSPSAQVAWLVRAFDDRRRKAGADVHFFPHYDAPVLATPWPSVVTVHDLIHYKVPGSATLPKRALGGLLLEGVMRRAARVITGSEAARRDLAERFPRRADKVVVVEHGVDPFFAPRSTGESSGAPPAGLADGQPFLLCVGNRKPHKNLAAAVEVLALLRDSWPELRLLIVGKTFEGWDDVAQLAARRGVTDRIIEREFVDDGELREAYRRCEALLFPSLYEGFGLPVIEAMACGRPVVAARRSSLPEVVGEAGVLVEPDDYPAMADAVRRLRTDDVWRSTLIERGRVRAGQFTWASAARRTADHLVEVAFAARHNGGSREGRG